MNTERFIAISAFENSNQKMFPLENDKRQLNPEISAELENILDGIEDEDTGRKITLQVMDLTPEEISEIDLDGEWEGY